MFEHANVTLYYFMLINNRSIGNRQRRNEMKCQSLTTRKVTFFVIDSFALIKIYVNTNARENYS